MSSDDVIPLPTSALSEIMHSGKKSCKSRKLINAWKEITLYELMIKIILLIVSEVIHPSLPTPAALY